MWRIFVALPVPEEVTAQLHRLQRDLCGDLPENSIGWTRREQMHLTLRFLGDIAPEHAGEIESALVTVCASVAPFGLHAESVGFFPNARRPRVIWTGVRDTDDHLAALHSAITDAIKQIVRVPDEEGAFCGHLTVGRVKRINARERAALADRARKFSDRCFGTWMATSVEIVRSELLPSGSRYTLLASIGLRGLPA